MSLRLRSVVNKIVVCMVLERLPTWGGGGGGGGEAVLFPVICLTR